MTTQEAVIETVEIPSFLELCPETLMPTCADMKNMIKQLAAMPAKILAMLELEAETMAQNEIDGLMSEVEQLREVVETILDVIDAPNLASIAWAGLRGEIGVDKIFQKYPTYLITEIIKIITKILDIKVEIPIPPLPISIDILKFVGDKDYKAELIATLTGNGEDIKALLSELDPAALGLEAYTNKINELKGSVDLSAEDIAKQIADLNPDVMGIDAYMDKVNELKGGIIDPLYELLPPEWRSFGGEEGLEIPELKGEAVIAFIESKISGLGVGLLMDAFSSLISIFEKIWKLLGLPDLPIPLSLDIGAMIKEIVEAEKAKFLAVIEELDALDLKGELTGEALMNAKIEAFDEMGGLMLEGLEGLEVAGFSVMDMIGGDIDDPVETLALKKKRICEEIGRFKDNYMLFLLRKWMEVVTSFLEAIGLGKLVELIGLDFCTFLGILGFPKAIDLSFSDHIKEVPSTMASTLPSGFELTAAELTAKNAADALPRYTAAANQTTFTGTDNNNNTLSYVAGQTTVFKTGVSLEDYVIDEADGDKLLLEDGEDIVFEVSSQYTATNGSSIVLTDAANVGDIIFIIP